jgi:L-cysteine:1D-myo-inositol 2-amino-2-deoxy-alpha-D-glucopyranoside ligase
LLAGHWRSDRAWTQPLLERANVRLADWREAVRLEAGPPAEDAVSRLRIHLADDLDTPAALAAVDGWAAEARTRRGREPRAPQLMRDAVDALLGVAL